MSRTKYNGNDLCIIIPTKDRPSKISNLLNSIQSQNVLVGRIIIVDGGISIKRDLLKYNNLLIDYYICNPPGQIRQRNLAISKLDDRTSLIITLDDDIVLMPFALENILNFWNNNPYDKAAVSFNIINEKPLKHNFFFGLIGLTSKIPGRVLKSGLNTPIISIYKDIKTQWVSGGATLWKKEFLTDNVHKETRSKWAPCEDLIFSYPIGKTNSLFVCADAKVKHEHEFDLSIKQKYQYYGYTETVWRFYFVQSHKELSKIAFFRVTLFMILIRLLLFVVTFKLRHFQFGLGQLKAVLKLLRKNKNILELLNDK
jgi:glycosyltransferase involved in cell wall biosynthesis